MTTGILVEIMDAALLKLRAGARHCRATHLYIQELLSSTHLSDVANFLYLPLSYEDSSWHPQGYYQ